MDLIISLLSGAIGGNVAGAALKKFSLGTLWNSVVGILGGGVGSQLLGMLGVLTGGQGGRLDLGNIVGNVASSGVGGGVLMVIVGLVKQMIVKK